MIYEFFLKWSQIVAAWIGIVFIFLGSILLFFDIVEYVLKKYKNIKNIQLEKSTTFLDSLDNFVRSYERNMPDKEEKYAKFFSDYKKSSYYVKFVLKKGLF